MRPTLSLGIKFRKLRLTTKDIKKGFYKGNRTGAMGRHTKYGGYIIEWNKVRTYPVPPLEGFTVSSSLIAAIWRWTLEDFRRALARKNGFGEISWLILGIYLVSGPE